MESRLGRLVSSKNSGMTPTVSVCLPVYNGEAFLAQAIESVLSQSFQNFELVISDDCSTDSSPAIVERFARTDKRIIWWRNDKRMGLFANYNKCMQEGTGIYIKPFAQDDLWASELISRQANVLDEHHQVALVSARRMRIDEQGHTLAEQTASVSDFLGSRLIYSSDQVIKASLTHYLNNLIGEPCAVMFRKSSQGYGFRTIFKHIGDLEYWLRILRDGQFAMVNEPLVFFRQHGNAATASNANQLWAFSDVVHLARYAEDELARMGLSQEQFIKQSLQLAANIVPTDATGELDLTALKGEDNYSDSDVLALKKSFLWALSMIGEAQKTANLSKEIQIETARNERLIRHQEQTVAALLGSISWRITRPLRELNCLLHPGSKSEFDPAPAPSFLSPIARQRYYLRELAKIRKKVLGSRSWSVTEPLRRVLTVDSQAEHVEEMPSNPVEELPPDPVEQRDALVEPNIMVTILHDDEEDVLSDLQFQSSFVRKEGSSNVPYDMILALHDASRTGAPMLGLALSRQFLERGLKGLVVLLDGGELVEEFSSHCDVLDLSQYADRPGALDAWLSRMERAGLLRARTRVFANSAATYPLCHIFKRHELRIIALVHEFLSSFPYTARANLVSTADVCVFSSQSTLNDALTSYSVTSKTVVIPQGLIDPQFGLLSRSVGRDFLHDKYGIGGDTFVVLACGTASQRKGIDVFAQAACQLLEGAKDRPDLQFIWVGGHDPVVYDALWWAKRDVESAGIEHLVHFAGAQKNIEPYFVGADAFMLPSREDPLPCVLHMAHAAALPVVAFEKSGGAEEVLAHGGGTVVPYGSVSAMSAALLEYYKYRTLCTAHGITGRQIVSSKYRLDSYVDSLLELAGLVPGSAVETSSPQVLQLQPVMLK